MATRTSTRTRMAVVVRLAREDGEEELGEEGEEVRLDASAVEELERKWGAERTREWIRARGGRLEVGTSPRPEEDPALVRRREWLKARAEQREYARMVSDAVAPGGVGGLAPTPVAPEHTGGAGVSAFRQSLVGLNMVIGAGCAYVAADYVAGTLAWSKVNRAWAGLLAMVAALFIEMTLYVIRAAKFEDIDKRRAKRAEMHFSGLAGPGANYKPPELVEFLEAMRERSSNKKEE